MRRGAEFADALREARTKHGLSQRKLAVAARCWTDQIQAYEWGENLPRLEMLADLCDALPESRDALISAWSADKRRSGNGGKA